MGLSGGGTSVQFPEPADTSGMEEVMMSVAEMGAAAAGAQLEFAKQQWGEQRAMMQEVMDVQLPMMRNQAEWALEDRERWETEFKPLEDEMIATAKEWNSEEKRELEAGKAQADVTKAFANQRQNALRKLEAMGIDPSQTRSQALDRQVRAQEAATQAAAGNNARRQVEQVGLQLMGGAASMGKGLPMQAVQTGASAGNIGSQAVGNYNQSLQANNGLRNTAANFMNSSTNAAASAGNLINAGYSNQLAGWQMQNDASRQKSQDMWAGLGSAAGMAAMFAEGGEAGSGPTMGIPIGSNEGTVIGPGGPKGDMIPAQLSDGEYVIPAEVVHYKGTEHFDKLINKSRESLGVPPEELQMQAGVPVAGIPEGV